MPPEPGRQEFEEIFDRRELLVFLKGQYLFDVCTLSEHTPVPWCEGQGDWQGSVLPFCDVGPRDGIQVVTARLFTS